MIATLVAAGGRLLLAAAMRLVKDAGGAYVFCDTDSLFIAASADGGVIETGEGRTIDTLRPETIDGIVARFEALNPYDSPEMPASILQLEDENFDPESGEPRLLECIAIASKRYVMYVTGADGRPQIIGHGDRRRRSEHGLGHLLSPTDPDSDETWWIDRWWGHVICWVLGIQDEEPDWFSQPAIGRLTVTSHHEEGTFSRLNKGRAYAERVRPWNFLMMAHPDWSTLPGDGHGCLVAAYQRDPAKRTETEWNVRGTPDDTYRIRTGNVEYVVPGTIVVKTYGDYFAEHLMHVDAKMAGADGRPVGPWTRGPLSPLEVRAATVLTRVGKESKSDPEQPEMGAPPLIQGVGVKVAGASSLGGGGDVLTRAGSEPFAGVLASPPPVAAVASPWITGSECGARRRVANVRNVRPPARAREPR